MPGNLKPLKTRSLAPLKAASLLLLLLIQTGTALAQTADPEKKVADDGINITEILLMVGGIVFIAIIAWLLGSGQSKNETPSVHHHPHKHYDHPNDPHFRKLKRKTS